MNAVFDCDLNGHVDVDTCKPAWQFSRLDKTPTSNFSEGFNFYESSFDNPASCAERTIVKRYGLKFEFNVSGQGGQFSIMRLGLALGSGLAFLSIASLVTDFVLQHFWHGKEKYKMIRSAQLDEDHLNDPLNDRRPSYDQMHFDVRDPKEPAA